MTEYLHKVRPVERVELEPGEYKDDRPFTQHKNHQGNMFIPPAPLGRYNNVDVKLSNGNIHYVLQANYFSWKDDGGNPYVIAYRKSDTRERDALLRSQIEGYYGKKLTSKT